jgi:hypothetical protein
MIPSGIARTIFLDTVPVISIISLNRLIVGGAAMLALNIKNHNIDKVGVQNSRPLVKTILRVCLIS